MPLKRRAALVTSCDDAGELPLIALDLVEPGGGRLTTEELPIGPMPAAGAALVRPGDVLYGKLRPYLAKSLLVSSPAYASTELLAIRTTQHLYPRFLAYLVQARPFVEWTVATSEGTKMPRTSWDKVGSYVLEDVALEGQRAIADFLDTETTRIDGLITKKRRVNDLLEERLDSLVEELVWRRPDSADRWDAVPLRRVASRVDVGIAEAASHAYVDEGVPLVRSTNIRPNFIETEGMLFLNGEYAATQQRKVVRAGDILTVRTGSTGVSAVVPDSLDGCQTFTQLISTVRPPHLSEFVAYALNSLTGREYFELLRWGSAQDNISVPTLAGCPVPFADASAQESAVRRIRKARAAFGALRLRIERQLRLLQEHRQALITAAVTGDLKVPGVAA